MDLYDDYALRRPISFPLNLRRLPTELVHQVMDHLPLNTILQILAHKDPHLNNCVITHRLWVKVFRSAADIDSVIDTFIIYYEILRFLEKGVRRPTTLGFGGTAFNRADNAAVNLQNLLTLSLRNALPTRTRELALLGRHTTKPYPGNDADVEDRWKWVKEAKRNQNEAKSRQLNAVADLLTKYPEKLKLKKPLDPDQGGPRKNLQHVENGLRVRARKALQNRQILFNQGNLSGMCQYGIDNIELIPYDRCLWSFLDSLKKHPIEDTLSEKVDSLGNKIARMAIDKRESELGPVFDYPADILREIRTVLAGLEYIYTGPSQKPVINRVRWGGNPYATGHRARLPEFNIEWTHSDDLPDEFHRCGVYKVMVYDEREYEWLRSFLKVVTWMEDEFGAVEVLSESDLDKEEEELKKS